MMRTYQSRPMLSSEAEAALRAYAELYSRAGRCLFGQLAAGEDAGKLKPSFMLKHGLTARQFNAMAFSIKGKIKSLIEVRKLRISDLQERIATLEYQLSEKLKPGTNKYHQKKRKSAILRNRLAVFEQDQKSGKLRMCFGRRKLFQAQFNLEENGYKDHAAWKRDWEKARSKKVFVLGSKDETAGCQGCQLVHLGSGLFSVKLRLPNADTERFATFHARKPLAIEKLDFARKKQDLKDSGVEYARMLSRLAYSQVLSTSRPGPSMLDSLYMKSIRPTPQ